jgi:2-iminobutanoate/2-iminopropanoate deaminase
MNCVPHIRKERMKNIISTTGAPKAIGPYSQAIKTGKMLFTSGQIPIDPATGEMVTGDIKAQTERIMKNLEAVLIAGGMNFGDVVKTTVFLADMKTFADMNGVYAKYFPENPPARSTVQVAKLPKEAGIEIEVVAIRE